MSAEFFCSHKKQYYPKLNKSLRILLSLNKFDQKCPQRKTVILTTLCGRTIMIIIPKIKTAVKGTASKGKHPYLLLPRNIFKFYFQEDKSKSPPLKNNNNNIYIYI